MDGLPAVPAEKILRYVQVLECSNKMGWEFRVVIALIDLMGGQVFFAPLVNSVDDLSFLFGKEREEVEIRVRLSYKFGRKIL